MKINRQRIHRFTMETSTLLIGILFVLALSYVAGSFVPFLLKVFP